VQQKSKGRLKAQAAQRNFARAENEAP